MKLIQQGQVFVPPDLPDIPEGCESEQDEAPFLSSAGSALTRRQRDVIQLLAEGKSNKEIASILQITEGTVKVHVNAAFRALGVHNRVSAVVALNPKQINRSEENTSELQSLMLISSAVFCLKKKKITIDVSLK